jgi:hypothetical protein
MDLGDFVRVKPGVSNLRDHNARVIAERGDLARVPRSEGLSRVELVGRTGTVIQTSTQFLDYNIRVGVRSGDGVTLTTVPLSKHIVDFRPADCPPEHAGCVLVDSHVKDGLEQGDGLPRMREWFTEGDLELVD